MTMSSDKPQQPRPAVEHLKQAMDEVSAEPGATIAYGHGHHPPPPEAGAPLNVPPEARDLLVAPSSGDPGKIDVVGGVTLQSGAEIRARTQHGFGASAGPVRVEEGGGEKVVAAHAAEEKQGEGEASAGAATAGEGEGEGKDEARR